MNLRPPTVAELKAQRIIYVTAQIEQLRELRSKAFDRIFELQNEKDRLVEHIGYDPTRGQVPR